MAAALEIIFYKVIIWGILVVLLLTWVIRALKGKNS
jgi:hypothetical protein